MSAVAIYLKTESGDDYLFCYPALSVYEIVERVKGSMGEELGYVWNVMVSESDDSDNYAQVVVDLLNNAIEQANKDDE